jgi:hypothetical protein
LRDIFGIVNLLHNITTTGREKQSMDSEERRTGEIKAVPDNEIKFMNRDQVVAYRGVERFGWYIKFIRRPLFQRPIIVLSNPDGSILAVLEDDGTINEDHGLVIR